MRPSRFVVTTLVIGGLTINLCPRVKREEPHTELREAFPFYPEGHAAVQMQVTSTGALRSIYDFHKL